MAAFHAGGNHGAAIKFIVESGSRFPADSMALVGHVRNAAFGNVGRALATMVQ